MGWVTLSQRKMALKLEHQQYQLRLLEISREKRQLARKKTYETNSIMMQQKQSLRDLKNNIYNKAKDEKEENLKILKNAWLEYQTSARENTAADKIIEENNYSNAYKDYMEWREGHKNGSITQDYDKWYNNANRVGANGRPYALTAYRNNAQMLTEAEIENFEEQINSKSQNIHATEGYFETYSDWEESANNQTNLTKNDVLAEFEDASLQYQEQQNEIKSEFEFELQVVEEEAADEEVHLDQEQTEIEAQMEAISQEMNAVGEAVSSQIQASTIKLA